MVKLYPTLIANSVSKNIIPGILKSIERYAMIYRMGDIMKQARKDLGVEAIYRKVGAKTKIIVKETDEQLINFLAKEFVTEALGQKRPAGHPSNRYAGSGTKKGGQSRTPYSTDPIRSTAQQQARQTSPDEEYEKSYQRTAGQTASQRAAYDSAAERQRAYDAAVGGAQARQMAEPSLADKEAEAAARERGKQSAMPKSGENATVGIGPFDMTSLMLEPSWMKIDMETKDGSKHSGVIGVKAVPVAVKSDASLAQLIMWDKQIGKIMTLIIRFGRPVEGMFYRAWRNTVGRLFGTSSTITGNPFKDIVMKRTIMGTKGADDIFLVLNQADLPPDFASRATEIQKLFRLSWESFCIADDVNRRVAFCMKQFKGMCSIVPYSMLYQTLGQARVFEDMEDVRRSTGSLFKSNKNMKKVLGEGIVQRKLDEYSVDLFPASTLTEPRDIELLQEIEMLNENFAGFVKRVMSAPKQVVQRAMKGNIKVPDIGPDRIAVLGRKINKDFKKAYELAEKVIGNSITEIKGKTVAKWAALLVVLKALPGHSKDLLPATREQLIKSIPVLRRGLRKAAQKAKYKVSPPPTHWPEVFVGTVIFMSFVTVGWQFLKGAYDIGLFSAAWKAGVGTLELAWSMAVGSLNAVKGIIKALNQDPETAKSTAKGLMGDMKEGLEGAADTWVILAFAIVGIVATFKLIKTKSKGE